MDNDDLIALLEKVRPYVSSAYDDSMPSAKHESELLLARIDEAIIAIACRDEDERENEALRYARGGD